MQDVKLFIKYLDDEKVCNEKDAEEVVADLIENSSLGLQCEPLLVENKYDTTKSYQYELESKGHLFIDYYELSKRWCSERDFVGWLRVYSNSSDELVHYHAQVYTRVSELSIGNFIDHKTYIKHINLKPNNCKRIILDFEHDMQKVTCYIITENEWYKLLFEYTSVEGFVVGDIFHDELSMYLPIRNPPKVWTASKDDLEYQKNATFKRIPESKHWPETTIEENIIKFVRWYRHNAVGDCKPEVFGSCSVFQFCIGMQSIGEQSDFSHKQVIAGFLKHRYTVYFSPINEEPEKSFRDNIVEKLVRIIPESLGKADIRFSIRYGILMLVSKGTRFTDKFHIGSEVYTSLQTLIKALKHEEEIIPLIKTFALLCNRLDKRRFIDIPSELQTTFEQEKVKLYEMKDVLAEKSKNLLSIRRIIITPSRTLFQPPELNTSNRILRKFNHDNFVRVSFRDEDYGPLNLNWEYDLDENSLIKRVSDLFHNGIQIGDKGRCYRFLGCSNSQLRSSGAWFVYEHGSNTVESIRKWVGDFSKERCLAKYVARLGQAFTTTESLLIDTAEEETIEDIETENETYTFSDGIGKISLPIAKKIKEEREMEYLPSAFQIRYGGCKGMVALDPTLGDERSIIQIRPSMKKFESNHKDIEFCQASKPSQLYMNRQVIWLLRGYGVPRKEFVNLQNNTLLQLADSLKDPVEASKSLMNYQGDGIFKQVLDSGIDLTQEPFHRLQLLSLYKFHVKEVLDRTRIVMPDDIGRQMLGVMDETGILEYGEVFVQYSRNIAVPGKDRVIRIGKLFITKNPCVHPGDLRTFTAKNVPELSHMCDVVVFPSKGKRPHPSELSGSDLDGDEYFVCWLTSLIPEVPNRDPGGYLAPKSKLESSPITPTQLTNQVVKHITKPNNLGKISNAHQVHCDMSPDGVNCDKAIELAEQHSIAVDYPKTGVPEDFKKELRVYEYPNWMEKPDKPCYKSTSVVGDCYRICRSLDHVLGEQDVLGDPANFKPDPIFIHAGCTQYLGEAVDNCKEYNKELFALMSQYGIEHEGDIACGCLNTVKQSIDKDKKKNYDITEECVRFYRTLQTRFQKRFFEEFNTKKGEWKESPATEQECYKKAAAWYLAAYKYEKAADGNLRLLSFPWCVSEVLCELVRTRNLSGEVDTNALKQESCTQQMISNMTEWFTSHLTKLKENPTETYTSAVQKMEVFVEEYKLTRLDLSVCGLPYNPNLLTYYCSSQDKTPLAKLQQDMFEKYPGWDKSYLDLVGTSETYLSLRFSPNICVFYGNDSINRVYTIRQYLSARPDLQIPAAVIVKWVQSNSLDSELHVLPLDFVLLFIMVLVMDRKIDPINNISPKEHISLDDDLHTPLPLTKTENANTAELYFHFLKSLIYGSALQDLRTFPYIPSALKELNTTLCSILGSNRTKFVSYAMREYHETCYFLFNKDQDGTETSRRKGKRNKIAKYKPDFVYPVCYDTELCAQHLHKHSNLEVNMRKTNMQRDEIIVIEVWGSTPEVLQDVIESMIFPVKTEFFKRINRYSNDIYVHDSHRIYLGQITKNKDNLVVQEYRNGEGYNKRYNIKVLDLPNAKSMVESARTFLRDRTNHIRTEHNVYAHGTLAATCEFGRFHPFRNSCEAKKNMVKYTNTMDASMDDKGCNKLKNALMELGFKLEASFYRARYRYVQDKVPITLHINVTPEAKLQLDKLTWSDMTWCEMHLFNERNQASDRHSHRDMIFNIKSCAALNAEELKKTNNWRNLEDELEDMLQYIPPYNGKDGVAELTPKSMNSTKCVRVFKQVITEKVESYILTNSMHSRLSKVKFELVTRFTKTFPCAENEPKSWHLIAHLPYFDGQSIGLVNEFFETCNKLR